MLFILISCNYQEKDSSKKADEILMKNRILTFELASIKETMKDYEVLIRVLTSSVDEVEWNNKELTLYR